MKCMDCGRPVANWPAWLDASYVGVRCTKCAGSGSTTINAIKPPAATQPLTEPKDNELVEAA